MKQAEFQQRAKQWLSKYKRDELVVEKDGIWARNKQCYPHILPKDKEQLNILPSIGDEFWAWFMKQHPPISLHRDFHHLNSSQALCFNLFFPLMMGDGQGLARLLSVMKIAASPGHGASFEFQPDRDERTCIDFSVPLQSGARVNFEVKFTETEFGSVKAGAKRTGSGADLERFDRKHRDKFSETYKPRLAGRFEEPLCCETWFLEHYQIARNIWHLNEVAGDVAVFLFPKANTCLRREEETIRTCAVEPFRSRIRILYLEDLIVGLHRRLEPSDPARRQHLEEFRLKYFPDLTFARCDTAN